MINQCREKMRILPFDTTQPVCPRPLKACMGWNAHPFLTAAFPVFAGADGPHHRVCAEEAHEQTRGRQRCIWNRALACFPLTEERPTSHPLLPPKGDIDCITVPDGALTVVHEAKEKVDLTKYLENHEFQFDYSFDDACTNETVYKYTAAPMVHTIFNKGMATCFAYGQVRGEPGWQNGRVFRLVLPLTIPPSCDTTTDGQWQDVYHGRRRERLCARHLCPRGPRGLCHEPAARAQVRRGPAGCSSHAFPYAPADLLPLPHSAKKLSVNVSFFEIYGGKVFDLLNKQKRLRVLEDGKAKVQVVGLVEKVCVQGLGTRDVV